MGETAGGGGHLGAVTRAAEYVGSFPVDDSCLDQQIRHLHTQLESLKHCRSKRSVTLKFTVNGVKVYDEDEATLLMAHAMSRVSFSTARPADSQFAFVSHNPGCLEPQLYCHLFRARHARAAQFLNLLLCRCFQLYFLEKHPEEAATPTLPRPGKQAAPPPSLLNQGFPLSVSALVSFRRAPTRGLIPGAKDVPEPDQAEHAPASSPTVVRKAAIRTKVLRSGAYRSFTFTPLRRRHLQEKLSAAEGKEAVGVKAGSRSLVETEAALAQAVWCWDGVSSSCSSSLLVDDVPGSFLLCPDPRHAHHASLLIRCPSGVVSRAIKHSGGKFCLEKCGTEFESLASLIEQHVEFTDDLECSLSCARVNHGYDWEEPDHRKEPN